MPYKAIIFDRDGTLNATSRKEGGYVLYPDDVQLLPFVKETLTLLKNKNIALYVFTQQRCIGKKLLTEEGLIDIHNRLNELLGREGCIDTFYHCPHLVDDGCVFSKPKPGMLLDCLKDHNLNPKEVLVVGDSIRDYDSAKAAGLDFAFVPNDLGKHSEEEYNATGQNIYQNLKELLKSKF